MAITCGLSLRILHISKIFFFKKLTSYERRNPAKEWQLSNVLQSASSMIIYPLGGNQGGVLAAWSSWLSRKRFVPEDRVTDLEKLGERSGEETLRDLPEQPHSIAVSSSSVVENTGAGTIQCTHQ